MEDKIWLLTVKEVWDEEPSHMADAFRDFDKANAAFQALVRKTRDAYKEAFGEDVEFDTNTQDKKLTYECWQRVDYYEYNTVITLELITVK